MKTILITGATDGIGKATALELNKLGHHLLVHGRDAAKLATLVSELQAANPQNRVDSYVADLSDFAAIRTLIATLRAEQSAIDIIINNAGVYKTANTKTAAGLDVRFMVNTIASVMITTGLLPLLSADGRVITLSSAAQAAVNLNALQGNVALNDFEAYAQSKLALTMWTADFAQQLTSPQLIVAVNPGSLLATKMVKEGFGTAGNDINIGSSILIEAAFSERFADRNGQYFDNDSQQFAPMHSAGNQAGAVAALVKSLDAIIAAHYTRHS